MPAEALWRPPSLRFSLLRMSSFDDQARLRPFLLSGERIVWTGRPRAKSFIREVDWADAAVALFLVAFAWLQFVEFEDGERDPFAAAAFLLAISFALFGIFCFALRPWIRRRMIYAVTNQRVLILGRKSRQSLETHDLAWLPMLVLEDEGDHGTITIEDEPERAHFLQNRWRRGPEHAGFAFARIDHPRQVYDIIVRESRGRRLDLHRDPSPLALAG